tara:strand:- start:2499 stop:3428 length:930 start_codon:yes stop_codon:yes gene_type:complete
MKNKMILIVTIISLSIMTAGEFSGYSIFNYDNETFSVNRAYLQYTDDLSDDLFFKLRYDVGRDSDGDPTTVDDTKLSSYLKNVYVDWKNGDNSKFSFGLISMNSFGVQEKNWGYRFVAKSPLDYHGFISSTADFGIGYSHSFGEFNTNVQIVNGDGYKKNDSDGKMLTSLRFMYGESKLNKNDGHNVGIVMTSFDGESDDDADDYSLIGLFGGWSSSGLRLGLEYNSYDYGSLTDKLTSFYLSYKMSDALNLFARHDMLNTHDDALSSVDETISMLGAVWNPTNGLYICPNVAIEDGSNDYSLTFMFKY